MKMRSNGKVSAVAATTALALAALFMLVVPAKAGRCKSVAALVGGQYSLTCIQPCSWGCTEAVVVIPGQPTWGAVTCACKNTGDPWTCCHVLVVYQPDQLPWPMATGDCTQDTCFNDGVCTLSPAGNGDQESICLQ